MSETISGDLGSHDLVEVLPSSPEEESARLRRESDRSLGYSSGLYRSLGGGIVSHVGGSVEIQEEAMRQIHQSVIEVVAALQDEIDSAEVKTISS